MLATGLSSSLGKGARPADKRGSLGPRDIRTSFAGSGATGVECVVVTPTEALSARHLGKNNETYSTQTRCKLLTRLIHQTQIK